MWIAFVSDDDANTRSGLQRAGFDFIVREPVHPAGLRLLLRRALYQGVENRLATRVAVGEPIRYATGLRYRAAVLADLSPRGCRLLCLQKLPIGTRIKLRIPARAAGGRGTLRVRAIVLRTSSGVSGGGAEAETALGLRFLPLPERRRGRIRDMLRTRLDGPAVLRQPLPEDQGAAPQRALRAAYEAEVAAVCADSTHVLLGRDLSLGGIRVEPNDVLAVGDRTQIAIQGAAREEPFMIEARVVRDDGERGMALKFEPSDEALRGRIQALLESLPSFESLQGDAETTVLTQVVGGRREVDG